MMQNTENREKKTYLCIQRGHFVAKRLLKLNQMEKGIILLKHIFLKEIFRAGTLHFPMHSTDFRDISIVRHHNPGNRKALLKAV